MPALTPAQNKSLVDRATDILEEASRLTSGVDPNYIRDAQPDSLFEALPLAAARQGCRRYADKGGNYPELRAARAERACRPYLDSIDYGDPPKLKRPFDGGQCPGVQYRVVATFQNPNTGALTGVDDRVVIGPVTVRAGGNQAGDPGANCEGTGLTYFSGRELLANGVPYLSWDGLCGNVSSLRSISVTPNDGSPDICGDPPPDYFPPVPPVTPGPTKEPFLSPPDIDVNIGVEVNIDGSINVDFGTGPITIDPFDEPPEDPTGGGGEDEPVPPGYQGDPGAPVDVGPGDAADETDPNRNLVGVLVQTIETPARANQVFNQTETYTKGAYFVYFGGDGGLSLNPEGAITIEDQFFYAPEGANRFRVVPNVGFTIRVVPFYNEAD